MYIDSGNRYSFNHVLLRNIIQSCEPVDEAVDKTDVDDFHQEENSHVKQTRHKWYIFIYLALA